MKITVLEVNFLKLEVAKKCSVIKKNHKNIVF